jgi:tetratricopeptide (TPR) repeat protein
LLAEAEAAARKALELNPELGEAHTSLGVVHQNLGDPPEVFAPYLERGVALAPNSADARKWYASYLSESNRREEALEQLQKAVQLDPMSPIVRVNLAGGLQSFGRDDEALAHLRRALEMTRASCPPDGDFDSSADQGLVLASIPYRRIPAIHSGSTVRIDLPAARRRRPGRAVTAELAESPRKIGRHGWRTST